MVRWLMTPDEPDLVMWMEELLRRPEWHARAACRGMGTEEFFPTRGHSGRTAQAICAGCDVVETCRAVAMADPDLYGIWGGTTDPQRRRC